jgi:hypothetical protein
MVLLVDFTLEERAAVGTSIELATLRRLGGPAQPGELGRRRHVRIADPLSPLGTRAETPTAMARSLGLETN